MNFLMKDKVSQYLISKFSYSSYFQLCLHFFIIFSIFIDLIFNLLISLKSKIALILNYQVLYPRIVFAGLNYF
jgi:hypothetical protein